MPVKVADASVVAALAFGEPRAQEALRLLNRADVCAPLLLPFELANVAWKKAMAAPEQREAILMGLAHALTLDIELVDVDQTAVFLLAMSKGITTYDATYLWVALERNAALVTFDKALSAAAEDSR